MFARASEISDMNAQLEDGSVSGRMPSLNNGRRSQLTQLTGNLTRQTDNDLSDQTTPATPTLNPNQKLIDQEPRIELCSEIQLQDYEHQSTLKMDKTSMIQGQKKLAATIAESVETLRNVDYLPSNRGGASTNRHTAVTSGRKSEA